MTALPTRLAIFDTETTGTDVESARIVSAFVGLLDASGNVTDSHEWLINPGVPIPDEATRIHGITTERVQAEGVPAEHAVVQLIVYLSGYLGDGIPLVAYNAAFDLTILDREARRLVGYGLEEERELQDDGTYIVDPFPWLRPVLDPFVLDKAMDRYRKGPRTLAAVAAHYGVPFDPEHLHGAAGDAVLAGRLMYRLWPVNADGEHVHPDAIHDRSVDLYRQQAESLADFRRQQGRTEEAQLIRTEWPRAPHPEEVPA